MIPWVHVEDNELACLYCRADRTQHQSICGSGSICSAAHRYGRCEGFAAIVLRPTDQDTSEGAPPLAIIQGSALNQGGRSSGLTAPNGPAQSTLIKCGSPACRMQATTAACHSSPQPGVQKACTRLVYFSACLHSHGRNSMSSDHTACVAMRPLHSRRSRIDHSQLVRLHRTALLAANAPVDAVTAVSMHGTGTPLGDPIEVGAITGAVRQPDGGHTSPVALLSNKACFGHSEGAAGLAGIWSNLMVLTFSKQHANSGFCGCD